MKEHNSDLFHISYFSRTLKRSETRYELIKRELVATIHGVQTSRYYFYGRKFAISSDSKPFKFYAKSSSPSDLVTR